ncbi:hypothetical protein PtA15_17A370 [Puccinia triticina]|uniref:Clr5 domain-containing protein n=1 Tax=Puccinia triticina TaxID=208348 RepID=A0ABY7D5H4_9BASI|nr:uncharacterized protein PtA15_17A370 [Puccinia triticina]WAQ92888.1 hypothetical protein PtA15_17A370 [Puccinia triticina]
MGDISTSDYSTETEGSDDSGDSDTALPSSPTPQDRQRQIVHYLLSQQLHGPEILRILREHHGIKMGIRTLDRKRKLWGLQQRNLPQGPAPIVQASIRSSHCKGLDLNEMKARLLKETGRDVAIRTIQRYLKFLNLKQIENDLQNGKTTIEKVVECINHARTELLQTSAGYRSMHRILKQFYAISLPR